MWVLVGFLESPNNWNYYEYENPNGQTVTIWTLGVKELLVEIDKIVKALKKYMLPQDKIDLENQLKVFRWCYEIKKSGIELLP